MGFSSFLGRVLFSSIFILSAWQLFNEFGEDGGPAVKELAPMFAAVKGHLASKVGVELPDIDGRYLVASSVVFKGLGGVLFIFGSTFGAYLLLLYLAFATPLLYDFYNYQTSQPEFFSIFKEFLQNVALIGAVLFFLGMKYSITRRQLKKKAPAKAKTT